MNVSFLAIPVTSGGSQSSQNPQLWSSPAGLASQVSITASVASIIFGSLLQRQHNRHPTESAEEAVCTCLYSTPFFFSFLWSLRELENKKLTESSYFHIGCLYRRGSLLTDLIRRSVYSYWRLHIAFPTRQLCGGTYHPYLRLSFTSEAQYPFSLSLTAMKKG